MKNTRKIMGAAAALAAGVVGVASQTGQASAQPQGAQRITSVHELKASIQQAASMEAQSTGTISCCPQGYVNPESTYVAQL